MHRRILPIALSLLAFASAASAQGRPELVDGFPVAGWFTINTRTR